MKKTFIDRKSIKVKEMRRAVSRLFRTLARGVSFGLSCVVSAICRVRPLWPSAPKMGNWLPCNGGRPQGPHPARRSECTRRVLRSFVCRIGHLQGAALVAVRTPDGKLVTLQWRTGTRAAPCNCDVTSNSQLRSLFTKHRIGPVRLSMSRENPLRPFSSSFFLLSLFFPFFPFSSFLLLSFFLLFLTSYLPPFLFLLPPSSAESLRL